MEKWLVIGGIWVVAIVCLVLFVRGASSTRNRAIAMARSRKERRQAQAQVEAKGTAAADHRS
ncbi:MAG TPA: hypothetical protein VL598_12025 [Trinickia sp.]|jgi:hypothetical protein|uniref:hypothetical protein n=1 Tax=Trinickia sp. TaxID=2571163 RepID=UPI002BDAA725|nr:hypothetical protein [Trinickia sp.]HTI18384.1 hypothetical protein [Trinickia sp.]